MAYRQTILNEDGEILSVETVYDDEPWGDVYDDDEYPYDQEDETDTTLDGFPHETDLDQEWL